MIRPRNLLLPPLLAATLVGGIAVVAGLAICSGSQQQVVYDAVPAPYAADVRLTVAEFPKHFTGSFIWDGEDQSAQQLLAMDVAELNEVDGLIVATGRGTYDTSYRDVDFTFRIEANPVTGKFTMWESNPSVATGFVTEGRHEATFTDSIDVVHARWVGDDGDFGTLELRAATESKRQPAHDGKGKQAVRALSNGVGVAHLYSAGNDTCVRSDSDAVSVHYKGWNADGVFDNSWDRGQPATFTPNRLIPGFGAALKTMCEGDFVRVWIPADQAYGHKTAGHGRPSGDLVFDIELVDVIGR